ncbi:YvcK family protein [Chloroflexi bacterium TSY]|nr:YvcK family protein [Chloroflexi bacterium TSY]
MKSVGIVHWQDLIITLIAGFCFGVGFMLLGSNRVVGILLLLLGFVCSLTCTRRAWQLHRHSSDAQFSNIKDGLQASNTNLASKEYSEQQKAQQSASEPSLISSPIIEKLPSSKHLLAGLDTSGPKIVAIGGGTGMPQLLRGLREFTDSITAIVTVADDGGSSGRLRRQMGLLPPGDFRNNIAALSDSEDLMMRLFQYRFAHHEVADDSLTTSELAGHSFGNLFIATMASVTGSFESGLAESSRILAVRGRVLPSTLEQVALCAEVRRSNQSSDSTNEDELILVEGESQIPEAGGQIERVFLKPESVRAYPEAIRAILQADLIVAGPGSFFTSIIPNLLVPSVREAICASPAPAIYICNVATQPGETDNYSVSDHMWQLRRHAGHAFTTALAHCPLMVSEEIENEEKDPMRERIRSEPVALPNQSEQDGMVTDTIGRMTITYRLFTGDLVDSKRPWRHDPVKLATRLLEVYGECRGGGSF